MISNPEVKNRLAGQKALVTGGSKGIGEAIALAYAREGADVVITYASDEKAADQVVKKIEKNYGTKAKAVKFDLLVAEDADRLLQQSVEFLGEISILVNNGIIQGHHLFCPFFELTEKDFHDSIAGNLAGTMRLTQKICLQMIEQKTRGNIINILSMIYRMPMGNSASIPYEAAKAALAAFTKSLAVAVGRHGIRVNAIAPGATETDLTRKVFPDELKPMINQVLVDKTPLGRQAIPEDYQDMAVALITTKFITGESIVIDGGLTCGSVFPLPPLATP